MAIIVSNVEATTSVQTKMYMTLFELLLTSVIKHVCLVSVQVEYIYWIVGDFATKHKTYILM